MSDAADTLLPSDTTDTLLPSDATYNIFLLSDAADSLLLVMRLAYFC